MDIEQLKLILEALGGAGEMAFWGAMVYFGHMYLNSILTAAAFLSAIFGIYKVGVYAMAKCSYLSQLEKVTDLDLTSEFNSHCGRKRLFEWVAKNYER